MKKLMLTLLSFSFVVISAYSQNSGRISNILNTEKITYGQAAYLIGSYFEKIDDDSTYEQSFAKLQTENYFSSNASANDIIPLGEYSLLCSKATNLKGGLFYTILKNQRYALRELKSKDILPSNADPNFSVDGHEAISVLSNCIDLKGAN